MRKPIPAPWDLTSWRGGTFTRRTAKMLAWVENRANVGNLVVGQGGWRGDASASASGSTHLKDAVDLSIRHHLNATQKARLLDTMKQAGFAAWIRPTVAGLWPEHLHAVPIPPSNRAATVAKYLSPSAAGQVVSYLANRDGLSGNRADLSYRPLPAVRFSYLKNKPVAK